MTIVLPIVLAGVLVGLFCKRVTPRVFWLLVGWILLVVVFNLFKK